MEQVTNDQPQSSPTATSHSERSQPEYSMSPEASESPVVDRPLTPPPRWPGRQFHRYVNRSPVSSEARKKILTTYDFEKTEREHPESVILELEKFMGYQGWPFIDEHDRARIIRDKAFIILEEFLYSHRFVFPSHPSSPFPTCLRHRCTSNLLMSTVIIASQVPPSMANRG